MAKEIQDADNQEQQESGVKVNGGGNTGLPFGLCAKYHIALPQDATPRDAWNALRSGVGLTPDKVYEQLKKKKAENKTVGKENPEQGKQAVTDEKKTESATVSEQRSESKEQQPEQSERKFVQRYGVDEGLAERANESYSMWGYKRGSASASYESDVSRFEERVNELIERYKGDSDLLTDEQKGEVDRLIDAYARNLSQYTNESNKVEASYPSWFIAGPANYNTRKSDAKYSRLRSLYEQNKNKINPDNNVYLKRIENILGSKVVQSNDENAVAKLQRKYDTLKKELENGKAMNVYFRKYGTIKGFPGVSDETAQEFLDARAREPYFNKQPYAAYHMTNVNAELRRIQGRIDDINKAKSAAEEAKTNPNAAASKYPKVDGVEVSENAEAMRLQLRFPGKPDESTRILLKRNGFKWSPTQNAWQRQLTDNARYSTRRVLEELGKGKD